MGISLLIMIICFSIAFFLKKSIDRTNQKEGVLIRDVLAKYIGGFQDIEGGCSAQIAVKEDSVDLLLPSGKFMTPGKIKIPMDMIITVEVYSETQITKDIGLGKLVLFGALAFAMKNSKTDVKNYLLLSYNDEGKKRDLIFESSMLGQIVREIRKIKGFESTF